jgi:ArsR family transcriptional regulator
VSTSPILDIQAGHPNLADVCCPPLLREPISASQAADLARLLKALADPTRLRLVSMVAAHEGGEACVCELTEPLGLPSPPSRTISRSSWTPGSSPVTSAAYGPTTRSYQKP